MALYQNPEFQDYQRNSKIVEETAAFKVDYILNPTNVTVLFL